MSGAIPKPVMKHLFAATTKRNLIEMFVLCTVSGIAFKTFFMDVTIRKYEEFYKTYDCEAALKRMNDAGLMQSCPKK